MRFEIEAELGGKTYQYTIAFELPEGFRELRVFEERLAVGGEPVYTRELAQVRLARRVQEREAHFRIDWHLAALPILQQEPGRDAVFLFKQWLARMLILRPMPALIRGDSQEETLEPSVAVTDFGAWFSGLLAYAPSAYTKIDAYLKQVMPDLTDIKNPVVGKDSRSLVVQFSNHGTEMTVPFEDLSDGEKCFLICALALAANDAYGPLLCFWDEPDNYLAPSEVGHFVLALRKAFQSRGQFIATSHNPEAIRRFSVENTFLLTRRSHFEPTIIGAGRCRAVSVNRYQPHVMVLPEDDANRQLPNGFLLDQHLLTWKIQGLEEAGGWREALDRFRADHVADMERYAHRFVVILIDFDGN